MLTRWKNFTWCEKAIFIFLTDVRPNTSFPSNSQGLCLPLHQACESGTTEQNQVQAPFLFSTWHIHTASSQPQVGLEKAESNLYILQTLFCVCFGPLIVLTARLSRPRIVSSALPCSTFKLSINHSFLKINFIWPVSRSPAPSLLLRNIYIEL